MKTCRWRLDNRKQLQGQSGIGSCSKGKGTREDALSPSTLQVLRGVSERSTIDEECQAAKRNVGLHLPEPSNQLPLSPKVHAPFIRTAYEYGKQQLEDGNR